MSGEVDWTMETSLGSAVAVDDGPFNYRGRKCGTCGGTLRLHERKFHKGRCALTGKSVKQKRRREICRQRALSGGAFTRPGAK